MSFSEEWERIYSAQRHLSVWPWTDLVSLVMRHVRPSGPGFSVLELGCGAGANIPFFRELGADYRAVEGSESVVARLHEAYPDLAESIRVGDFTREIPFDGPFDLVVDRGSLTHNASAAIRRSLDLARARMADGAALVGVDWFSDRFSERANGAPAEDAHSFRGFETGALADVGVAHFADKAHLLDLLGGFELVALEHKTVERHLPDDGWRFGAWNFVALKRE